jgi:AraC-like DNA-binding protein
MYSLTLKHNQPSNFATRVTSLQKTKLYDNALLIKAGMASGFFKAFALENKIHCLCSKYNPHEDFHLHKMPLEHEFFILRIDEISHSCNTLTVVDRKYSTGMDSKNQSVLLLSSLEEFTFFASKNSLVKTLEIVMPGDWFFSQLNIECSYELLKKYMATKPRKTQTDCRDYLFRNLFLEIIREANKAVSEPGYIQKKVNSLLTIFFANVSSHLRDFLESEKVKISKDEINRLMTVRKYLDVDLPAPTFTSLTKIALMSSTSLKTKFKKMYGTTVFEYFQSMRMQRARILLLTHKYSVKQIGRQLGYSNMSNFTIAFKKEFNQLPHELIKQY